MILDDKNYMIFWSLSCITYLLLYKYFSSSVTYGTTHAYSIIYIYNYI